MQDKCWDIVVDSIGNSGAGLIGALRHVSPLSENKLATMLYQAPARLLTGLDSDTANGIHELLTSAGLEAHVVGETEDIQNGDSDHEIALVVDDFSEISEVVALIIKIVGADMDTARKILCSSPTMFLGSVSAATVAALRPRFEALGVRLDVSKPADALYDAFCGELSAMEKRRLERMLEETGISTVMLESTTGLVATGLTKKQGDALWAKLERSALKVRLVSRDFQRYDLQLIEALDTPETMEWLVQSTGMPEKVARKIPKRTPVVLHRNITFRELDEQMGQIAELGAVASGQLLVFQTFSLEIRDLREPKACAQLLQSLGDLPPDRATRALQQGFVQGPFTNPQARWLQTELEKLGTKTKLVLHEEYGNA